MIYTASWFTGLPSFIWRFLAQVIAWLRAGYERCIDNPFSHAPGRSAVHNGPVPTMGDGPAKEGRCRRK